ncbi:MAG: uracil-DNA glycosylase family protein [Halieaceae bacterium]|nr:uracil-DNA glycosylase family protein [Halieaceae bacterium]
MIPLTDLLAEVRACTRCELPLGPRPVLRAHEQAELLIIGQAPGTKVHHTGIPWNDPSGDRLREWLQMSREDFYDERRVAIIPMAFCYPGKGKSGDLPPPPVCAQTWHETLLQQLPNIRTTLLLGRYAQDHYLHRDAVIDARSSLTERVRNWQRWAPRFWPMPHPSPRNRLWLRRNPWFEAEVVPALRQHLHSHH